MTLAELANKKLAIVGLGVNNRHLAEYFKAKGIAFEVFDNWQNPDELSGKLDGFYALFRTPGLPYTSRAIREAKQKGAIIYSQTKLFFDLCPCPIVGVTGTKGKGTTATLTARILEAAGSRVWLAGNIGQDPFEFVNQIRAKDIAVLELSSFQLQDAEKSPRVAVVLKITPDHLDHHESMDEYVAAKRNIVAHQKSGDIAVLYYDAEITRNFAKGTPARIFWNSTQQTVAPGCFVKNGEIILALAKDEEVVMNAADVKLPGAFNLENVTASIAAAAGLGARDAAVIKQAVSSFTGLPHRLELAGDAGGVKFYDDSFSTTPETAIAALSAFDSQIILIAGGSDKKADFRLLGKTIAAAKVKALLAIGATGPKIAASARAAGFAGKIYDDGLTDMPKIVAAAVKIAKAGHIVLLSPASASFDMFTSYKHRGELFKKFVKKLYGQKQKR